MARIAFIGLGNMGGGMAANLARAGHDVHAFDLSAEALARAKAAGCLPVESATAACEGAEAVVTMLPAGRHVEQVYVESVFDAAPTGALLLDCSTIDVATARAVASAAGEGGHAMVDAPVSGGIAAASAGTLTFMVGGDAAAFAKAEPILGAMGKAVIHAGASGAGQAAKICNNMLLAIHMIGTAEAFRMADRLGLDLQKFYDSASVSSGQNWSMTSYCPVPGVGPVSPADRGYEGGFATALMLKDLKLAMAAADSVDAEVPLGRHAAELYQSFNDDGNGGRDFSAIITAL